LAEGIEVQAYRCIARRPNEMAGFAKF
jgi:hypothetical protein